MILFVSLVPTLETKRLASAIPIALGLIGTYTSLIHIFGPENDQIDEKGRLETTRVIFSIGLRIIGLLIAVSVIMILTWSGSPLDITNAMLAGGPKAAHWIIIFWLVRLIGILNQFTPMLTCPDTRDPMGNRACYLGLCCCVSQLLTPNFNRHIRHGSNLHSHNYCDSKSIPNNRLYTENRKRPRVTSCLRSMAGFIIRTAYSPKPAYNFLAWRELAWII